MSKSNALLAIDQGTTGTTVIVFDRDGAVLARVAEEFTQYYPQPGRVEHDAMEIWEVTRRTMEEALQKAKLNAGDVHAIGITNQRESVVLWDRHSGQPVCKAIVWQDRRTADLCRQLKAEGCEEDWMARTGLLIDPYFSGTKIAWMLDQHPWLREKAEQGDVLFGTIDAWLIWCLTAGTVHVTDVSNASRTQLFNIHECKWESTILQRLGIPEAMLPRVVASSGVLAETAASVFQGATVPIAGVAGDQQAALFGQACHQTGMAKNTYGTGAFVLLNTGKAPVTSREKMLTTIAWQCGDEPVEYALEGSVFVTGAAVQWLRDGLGLITAASETEALARSVDDNGGVTFVPALTGLGAPFWNPDARGLIAGLTRGTTKAHLVRATLESIVFQSTDVLLAMCRDADLEMLTLRADGGGSVNGFMMQFQADILNVPVEVPVVHETTALGAAYLAGLATGFWPDRASLREHWKLANRYTPSMSTHERQRHLDQWHRAVDLAMRTG